MERKQMFNILKPRGGHPVCAEVRKDGRTMAHVMDLPGCIPKGNSLDQALGRLPQEIDDYRKWISSHFPQKSTGSSFWDLIEVQEVGCSFRVRGCCGPLPARPFSSGRSGN